MGNKTAAARAKRDAKRRAKAAALAAVKEREAAAARADMNGDAGGPVRPTPHQLASGAFHLPQGKDKAERPAVNLRPDCIAALMTPPARLDGIQHDAARDWQELRAAIRADLALNQGRSCLDVGQPGYDSTDGDVALAAYWRRVRTTLGQDRVAVLDRTCVEGAWPRDVDAFRAALDAFAVVHRGV